MSLLTRKRLKAEFAHYLVYPERSRQHPGVRVGLSPRAGIALLRAARAYALLLGRSHVLPEDVQALFAAVAAHRLVPEAEAASASVLAKAILHAVPVD